MARKQVACTRSSAASRAFDNTSAYRQRRASEDCSPARTSSRLASLMAPLEFTGRSIAAGARSETRNFFVSRRPRTNNGWANKWSAQRVLSAPTRSKERSNARFSSRRLARALELSLDAPSWIRDYSSGACLGRLRGWRGGEAGGGGGGGGGSAAGARALWER